MLKSLSVLAILVSALTAQAANKKVKCNIETLADAEKCMQQVAEIRPSYEAPNDGLAAKNTEGLVAALKLLGAAKKDINAAQKADFAGLMVEHGDESHIYYFSIRKGKNVQPKELLDLNLVDIGTTLEKPYSKKALDAKTYTLGLSGSEVDVLSEIEERLQELKGEEKN